MRPLHQFTVVSEIPEALSDIPDLAANLHWAWDRQLAAIFDRLDGSLQDRSWRLTGQHPVDLVRRTSQSCWTELAADNEFVESVKSARLRLSDAVEGPTWFDERRRGDGDGAGSPLQSVAYFSPAFCIP